MFKLLALTSLTIVMSSCGWLAAHPQVEADLAQIETDVRKDVKTTVDDILEPVPAPSPVTPVAK